MVKHTSIRVVLSLVVNIDMEFDQMDVRTTFLHGNLDKKVYMEQHQGFKEGLYDELCLLKIPIYGLKKSCKRWYIKFHNFITNCGFNSCKVNNGAYIRKA